ncbi:MAG: peptide chain release factor 1 [Firmicutes bacterium]|nr:peptide chain release factor 1 [Bacillota bacterium]
MNTQKLEQIVTKYNELTQKISDPQIIADNKEWTKLVKEHASLEPVVLSYNRLKTAKSDLAMAKEMLASETDSEMLALAKEELEQKKEEIETITSELKVLLLPSDPRDEKSCIVEVRAGTGGEEAALFAAALVRMYKMFASQHRFLVEEIDTHETELGGVKEASFQVSGSGAYAKLKFESGVHRVQRVPDTETQGRIHTSAATVAVLAEAEDIEIEINEKDLKIDTYRSGGAGGQHVNKTDSAVRLTHIPTGIVVQCQDERSQIKNRDKAMRVLKTKLYDKLIEEQEAKERGERKAQVGSGDRSERIRTYNFPQGRVTDHRIGMTLYSLDTFMNGDIASMIEGLRIADQTAKLNAES